MRCVLCGRRLTAPAVLLADQPVGPKCAARAGLVKLARQNKPRSGVRLYAGPRAARADDSTLDLFTETTA
jgi:hypothetical protein